jgi:hypothetical protein
MSHKSQWWARFCCTNSTSTCWVVYLDQPDGTPFFIDLFGLAFMFNLETTPEIILLDDLAKLGFELVSLELSNASSASAN